VTPAQASFYLSRNMTILPNRKHLLSLFVCITSVEAFLTPRNQQTAIFISHRPLALPRQQAYTDDSLSSLTVADTDALFLVPLSLIVLAIGVFLYANQTYTPEILQVNQEMRNEQKKQEVRKLAEVVQEGDLSSLRPALEETLGMSLEDYVEEQGSEPELVTVLREKLK